MVKRGRTVSWEMRLKDSWDDLLNEKPYLRFILLTELMFQSFTSLVPFSLVFRLLCAHS